MARASIVDDAPSQWIVSNLSLAAFVFFCIGGGRPYWNLLDDGTHWGLFRMCYTPSDDSSNGGKVCSDLGTSGTSVEVVRAFFALTLVVELARVFTALVCHFRPKRALAITVIAFGLAALVFGIVPFAVWVDTSAPLPLPDSEVRDFGVALNHGFGLWVSAWIMSVLTTAVSALAYFKTTEVKSD